MDITDEAGASQFGRKHSFQEGRNAELATCWDLSMSWSSCSSVTKNDTRQVIRCGLMETICYHISERTTQSQALGLGKQSWMATHSGEGFYLCEVGEGKQGSTAWKLLY